MSTWKKNCFLLSILAIGFSLFFLLPPVFSADEIRYDRGGRRDPFVPLVSPGGMVLKAFDPTDLKVEGIIFDPSKESLAVINGKVVKEGEALGSYKVAKIQKNSVMLSKEEESFTLRLKSKK